MAKKKDAPYQTSGQTKRVVLLGDGEWCYLFDHEGKTRHYAKKDLPAIREYIETSPASETFKNRLIEEFRYKGWEV